MKTFFTAILSVFHFTYNVILNGRLSGKSFLGAHKMTEWENGGQYRSDACELFSRASHSSLPLTQAAHFPL